MKCPPFLLPTVVTDDMDKHGRSYQSKILQQTPNRSPQQEQTTNPTWNQTTQQNTPKCIGFHILYVIVPSPSGAAHVSDETMKREMAFSALFPSLTCMSLNNHHPRHLLLTSSSKAVGVITSKFPVCSRSFATLTTSSTE